MVSKFTFNNQYLYHGLPEDEKNFLSQVMKDKRYRKNEAIFTEGTLPSGFFFLKEGKVKKYKVDKEGREQIIYIYKEGEFFGYSAVLSDESYGDTVVTLENCVIAFIPKNDFIKMLDKSSVFPRLLLKSLSHEFSVMVNFMTVLSQRTVRERTALILLILNEKYRTDNNEENVLISLSRTDMAKMAGTANETLARILHDFSEEKLILIVERKIKILKIDQLVSLASFY